MRSSMLYYAVIKPLTVILWYYSLDACQCRLITDEACVLVDQWTTERYADFSAKKIMLHVVNHYGHGCS